MLLTRVLTALVLLPLVIGAIFLLDTHWVAVILAAFLLLGAWEWAGLLQLGKPGRILFTLVTGAVCLLVWFAQPGPAADALLWLAVLWWLFSAYLVQQFPRGWDVSVGQPAIAGAVGLLILSSAFAAIVLVHAKPLGGQWLLLLFLFIWAADTGAYFSGRAFGAHKLAPKVSPGKTLEGAAGGVLACMLVAVAGGLWFALPAGSFAALLLLAAIVAPVSILGDLTESMFKRQAGIKDSGQIFPGHGGVLDRLDSILAAGPFFVLGLQLLGLTGR